MSEHKLPQVVRDNRGLTGIRFPARDADKDARRRANLERKYAGWRLTPALPKKRRRAA